MLSKSRISWICLVVLAVLVKLLSLYPSVVEKYYSTGCYPWIARLQRLLLGWIPFSIGDILYGMAVIWLLAGLVSLIRKCWRREAGLAFWGGFLRRFVFIFLLIYIVFYGCWGLNYTRLGIADQLQLEVKPYSNEELTELVQVLVTHLNDLDSTARLTRGALSQKHLLFAEAVEAYDSLAAHDARFAYRTSSIKPSLYSYLEDYLGFGGYYNPFSGEAQVNTTLPVFTLPFTACHEMAHQLGYAKENEANFVGYLSARSSADPAFRYSVYFDLYQYAARELYVRDSTLLKPLKQQLKPAIREDFKELQRFSRKYASPLEPAMMKLYARYLRANGQPQGIMTYNEVTAWLIAYARKNGMETI